MLSIRGENNPFVSRVPSTTTGSEYRGHLNSFCVNHSTQIHILQSSYVIQNKADNIRLD